MGDVAAAGAGIEVEWQFDASSLEDVATWLAGRARQGVREVGSADLVDRYFDTADWRLMRANRSLRIRERESRTEATLKSLGTQAEGPRTRIEITQSLEAPTIEALLSAAGEVSSAAHAVAGHAELIERGRVMTHRTTFEIALGRPRSAVATLSLDETSFGAGDGPVMRRVEVELLEGVAPGVLEPFVAELGRACHLTEASGSKFERALGENGGAPVFELPPDPAPRRATLGEIATASVAAQLHALAASEPVARLGLDPEGVHDVRVAIRRLRAGLRLLREAFVTNPTPVREELRWLGGELGGVRDLDVLLEEFAHWIDAGPPTRATALAPVQANLERDRDAARAAMLAALDSERHDRVLDLVRSLLVEGALSAAAAQSGQAVAARLLPATHRRFVSRARRISPTSPDAAWHELRIDGKRLRYALEFFAPVLGRSAERVIAALRRVQDVLGEVHDAAIAAERIAAMATRPDITPEAAFALGEWSATRTASANAMRAEFPRLLARLEVDWERLRLSPNKR